MEIVQAGGAKFEIEQTGSGPDLVLLHSLLTDPRSFAAIVPALSRSRRVTLVSLPGFGRSAAAGPSIEDSADRIAELLAKLGRTPDVLGNGYGGSIAVALAARHGAKLGKLVLADTAAAFPEEGRAPFRAMASAVEKGGMAAIVDTAVRRIFSEDWLAAHPEAVTERREVLLRSDPVRFAGACRALAAMDLRPELPRIQNPTLVVVGARDAATPPALARDLVSGIRGAKLIELPGCGHCPPLQQPGELVAAIAPFLGIAA
jgi:3-oxoadipate enol-lactonase